MQRRSVLAAMAGGSVLAYLGLERVHDDHEATAGGDGDTEIETTAAPNPDAVEERVLAAVNELRQAEHVQPLGRDGHLADAARAHSRNMAENGFYAHRDPSGREPWDRVRCQAGETLQRGPLGRVETTGGERFTADHAAGIAAFTAASWRESRGHYDILMDPAFRSAGIGFYESGGEWFVTAKFC